MKSKLLPILVVILMFMNGVLIFMLLKKSHVNNSPPQERNFLVKELQFTELQNDKFLSFDTVHRENMLRLDQQIRKQKDILFNSFSDGVVNIDSLGLLIGGLAGKKDIEVFRFFQAVRKICTQGQQEKFDKIINKALKAGKKRPSRGRRMRSLKDRKQ